MGLIRYSCGHISGPMNQFMSNLVCEGFSSCSTEIWSWKCWNAKKENLMMSHFGALFPQTETAPVLWGGEALSTMRCAMYMCHQKDPHFLSLLSPNDPLVNALSPTDPLSPVTQRPPISDCHPKIPNFWFCHPKTHHFNYLAQTLISHNN